MKNKQTTRIILLGSITLVLFLLPLLTPASVYALEPTDIFDTTFDSEIQVLMDIAKVESLSFSVVNDTEIFYTNGYGEQPGNDIVYYIMGLTNSFTSTAILQLQEDALLNIDDPINDYLPYILRNPYYPDVDITIKDLLTNQATLANTDALVDAFNQRLYLFPDILYELLNENGSLYSIDHWLNLEPGTIFKGAWIGFDIAAYIVEILSGENFEQYITDNIFTPLGMTNSYFNYTTVPSAQLVNLYLWNSTSGVNEVLPHYNSYALGSAGILSTTTDIAKFLLAHMNDGEYNSVRILETSSIQQMHTNYGNNYGLGWWSSIYADYKGLSWGPWLGTAYMIYKGDVGTILFTNQEKFDEGFAGKTQDILDYVLNTANQLVPETPTPTPTDTSFGFLAVPLVFAMIGTLLVIVRRRRN
jgi:CubicO group peptidase (beta-lactamase class C family)